VLYARSEVQEGLAPLVVSLGYGGGFASSFEYQGTRDPSGWLAAEAAVDFVQSCGGLDAVRVHNRRLAHAMAHRVAERCGLGWGGPPHAFAAMVTLMLPELSGLDEARALVARLWSEHRVQSFAGALGTTAALRISANLYNRVDEADALAEALSACA
jgi:isopenicillin-N epimerase